MPVKKQLENCLSQAFEDLGQPASLASLQYSDRPDLSDLQCNGALIAAKSLKQPPRVLAQEIVKKITPHVQVWALVQIDGPGFINFKLNPKALSQLLSPFLTNIQEHLQTPQPRRIILDYGGPNVAKPLHVGHLRSSVIGQALKNLLRYRGHHVTGDIHLGDWGTQMGMLILWLQQHHPEWPQFQENFSEETAASIPITMADLQEIYPKISAACKENPALAEQARMITHALQTGHPGYTHIWKHFVKLSLKDIKEIMTTLCVDFEQWFGESRYQDMIPDLLSQLEALGIAYRDEGALIIDVEKPEDQQPIPPLLLQKKDGGYLYGTTDLATLVDRVKNFHADYLIYVVDSRQSLHFEQVFRATQKFLSPPPETRFVGFGTLNGPDNKPFKTRAGGVMPLRTLIDMVFKEAEAKLKDNALCTGLSQQEKSNTAQKISLAALKFADLQHDVRQNYQFDPKKFTSFEGKTGPYLLYAAVRIQALLDKTDPTEHTGSLSTRAALSPTEHRLIIECLKFDSALLKAESLLAPNILCDYAFKVAQSFSRFYQENPILKEPETSKRQNRILLCKVTHTILCTILNILGIEIPERM